MFIQYNVHGNAKEYIYIILSIKQLYIETGKHTVGLLLRDISYWDAKQL